VRGAGGKERGGIQAELPEKIRTSTLLGSIEGGRGSFNVSSGLATDKAAPLENGGPSGENSDGKL